MTRTRFGARSENYTDCSYATCPAIISDSKAICCDCIVADVAMRDSDGPQLIDAVRAKGWRGAMVLLADSVSSELAAVPGFTFLSGGQSGAPTSARLNAMNRWLLEANSSPPWALAFSFARAIQQPAWTIWRGQDANIAAAQQALRQRAANNRAARRGDYTKAMEAGLE